MTDQTMGTEAGEMQLDLHIEGDTVSYGLQVQGRPIGLTLMHGNASRLAPDCGTQNGADSSIPLIPQNGLGSRRCSSTKSNNEERRQKR